MHARCGRAHGCVLAARVSNVEQNRSNAPTPEPRYPAKTPQREEAPPTCMSSPCVGFVG